MKVEPRPGSLSTTISPPRDFATRSLMTALTAGRAGRYCRKRPPAVLVRRIAMYSTCLYCKASLGGNESIETFPVGQRLAFDPDRGRLWVVCGRCTRWNLSPIEERWEAIEDCERQFRATRRRVSTEHIGLARLGEGIDLIRIGRPQRPEFAAWRYGPQLLRRRRRQQVETLFSQGAQGMAIATGLMPILWPLVVPAVAYDLVRKRRTIARIPAGGDGLVAVSRKQVESVRLLPGDNPEGWKLRIRHGRAATEVSGPDAARVAGLVLPHVNRKGASKAQVADGVAELERAGGPDAFFRATARQMEKYRDHGFVPQDHQVRRARPEIRLALEMAAHEETEQRALEGELHLLERAWREAEEIAAIADNLLIPASIYDRLRRLRRG